MKCIGIDIGSYSIKIVEITATAKGYQLVQFFTHQLTLKPNTDNHFEIIEFLRDITSKYDPENTKYIVGLRQDKVALRTKTFPFSDRNKIAKTLPLDLEEEIPFNIENAVVDFKINKIIPPTSEILAFVAKKEAVEKTLQLMKECGIQIEILSTEGSAFANLVEKWNWPIIPLQTKEGSLIDETTQISSKNLSVILNIGNAQTILTLFDEGKLIGVRNILWGGKIVAELIAKRFNLPLSEAHKELEAKGFILTKKQEISPEAKAFSDIISRSVRELVRDVQISLLEAKSEFNADISKIEITGGMSMVQGIAPYMTQLLEIPCNKFNTLDHFSQVYFEKNDINAARLGVAIGLAIEGLKKPRNPAINFLRGEFAKEDHRIKNFWLQWGSSVQVVFALLVIFYVWSFLRIDFSEALAQEATDNLKSVAKKTMGVTSKNATKKNIDKYISENKKTISDIKSAEVYYQMNSSLEILKKVSDHLPNKTQVKIDIKKFEIEDQLVILEGYVNTPLERDLTRESLKSLAIDEKIQQGTPALPVLANRIAFNFVFNVDRGIAKEK